jgi:quinol monooxygenase YgiN
MVTELADIAVTPGKEDAFAVAFAEAREVILASSTCRSARLTRSVGSSSRFIAVFEWSSVEEQADFASTEDFQRFIALIGPYFAQPPQIDLFTDVQ